jgi:hypothetical protein
MKLELTIAQDNAAFGETAEERNAETARILRDLASRLERGEEPETLRDVNGNKVGTVSQWD